MTQYSTSVPNRSWQWAGLASLALLGLCSAACGLPEDANVPTEKPQSLIALDAADSAFDESSCTGATLTRAEFIAKFSPGTSEVKLGDYQLFARHRTCNKITGCSAWSAPTQPKTGGLKSQEMGGALSLFINGYGDLEVGVRDSSTQEMTGHYPEFAAIGTSTLTFKDGGGYWYEYVDQNYTWSGGHLIPVGSPFRVADSTCRTNDCSYHYDWATYQIAALTKSCARIVSVATDDATNQYALLVRY